MITSPQRCVQRSMWLLRAHCNRQAWHVVCCLWTVSLACLALAQPRTLNKTLSCPSLACQRQSSDDAMKCRQKLYIGQGSHYVHYYSSMQGPLNDGTQSEVKSLVLVVHGINPDADKYFETMSGIVAKASACSTAVIAPEWRGSSEKADLLVWRSGSFLAGEAASNDAVYSFAVLDSLLAASATAFPNLASVTLVGHSAGAQCLQRYAGANRLSIPVKYVLANAGTYMYLTDERVSMSAQSELNSTCPPAQGTATCSLTAGDFSQPWDGRYDKDKYGLANLGGSYMAQAGNAYIRSTFPTRSIAYLLGDDDTLNNAHLDQSCAANAQGWYRKQRGLVFFKHLALNYPGVTSLQQAVVVPGCGHSESCMFSSSQFLTAWGPVSA